MPVVTLSYLNSNIYDTMVNSGNADYAGHYSEGLIMAGRDSNNFIYRMLLFFDLGLIPNDAIINSATLSLYNSSNAETIPQINIHKITSPWNYFGTTWNNKPSFDSTISLSFTNPNSSAMRSYDVKSIVESWVNGSSPNYGFLLKSNTETQVGYSAFGTNETATVAQRPQLVINYTIRQQAKNRWSMWEEHRST